MNRYVERGTAASKATAIAAIVMAGALASAPAWLTEGGLNTLSEFLYFLALAQLWNLLAGFGGIVSLGQHAFIGLGGYVLFALVLFGNVPPVAAFVPAAVAGALAALAMAQIVFRLQGAYLAIGTWVVAEVFRLGFAQVSSLGAGSGISLPADAVASLDLAPLGRDGVIYLVALALALATNAGVLWLLRSRHGLALTAIRDNEQAARSNGVDSRRVKHMIYVAAGSGTALIGALIYLTKFRISPSAAFDVNWTGTMIFIAVIGGVGTLEGPVVGALVFFLLREYLADLGSWYMIMLGAAAVLVMLRLPGGLWGTLAKRFNLQLFPTRRRLLPKA